MAGKTIITDDCLDIVVKAYVDECVSLTEISQWFGVTRQGLWKFLKRHGVETRKGRATRRKLVCDTCKKSYTINRAKYRELHLNGKQKKSFCSDVCYHAYLENKDTVMNRHKQRVARGKVSEVFDLQPEHVVHHRDFNHFNTRLDNFMVFASQRDHAIFHHQLRQGEVAVKPIWDGAEYAKGYFKPQPKGK